MNRDSAISLYLLGGVMFSLAGVLFKPLVGIYSPVEISAWRSVVVFFAILAIRKLMGLSITRLPISFSRWQCFSACAFALQTTLFCVAILLISTADTFLISNAAPIYLVFWRYLFDRQAPTKTELYIIFIALFGLFLFLFDSLTAVGETSQLIGLLAAFVGGLFFSGHIYAQGRVGKEGVVRGDRATQGSVILGSLFACALAFPLSFFFPSSFPTSPPVWSYFFILALGVFQLAIPMMLWAKALPSISPLFAAFMPTLIAVWAPLWTRFVLGEPFPGALAICGAVTVHLAVILASVRRVRAQGA